MINYKRGADTVSPNLVPTRFKQVVDKKKKKLVEISPSSKVVAALNKMLSKQSAQEGIAYFIVGESIYMASNSVTEGSKDGKPANSYSAKGRAKLGRKTSDGTSFEMAEFTLKFRDGTDDMGLPDLIIEEANIQLLDRSAPLDPSQL